MWDQFLDGLAALAAASATNDLNATVTAFSRMQGQLAILVQRHEQLREQMEAYLGETEAEQESAP